MHRYDLCMQRHSVGVKRNERERVWPDGISIPVYKLVSGKKVRRKVSYVMVADVVADTYNFKIKER